MTDINFHTFLSGMRKEVVAFLEHNILVMQVSGQFSLETTSQKVSLKYGQILMIGKYQLGQVTKLPLPEENYETILNFLQEDILRNIALEEKVAVGKPYAGPRNIRIPANDFLQGYFQSIVPYVHKPAKRIHRDISNLKVKEAVILLLDAMPALKDFCLIFLHRTTLI